MHICAYLKRPINSAFCAVYELGFFFSAFYGLYDVESKLASMQQSTQNNKQILDKIVAVYRYKERGNDSPLFGGGDRRGEDGRRQQVRCPFPSTAQGGPGPGDSPAPRVSVGQQPTESPN